MTRLLTRNDLASLLTLDDCLEAVEAAFRVDASTAKSVGFHAAAGTFHVKAAVADVCAAKINANFPDNPRHHALPTIQGVIVVMDVKRGTVLAILDSALITTLRTAAATALAAKLLAREDASVVTIAGCGTQGRASLDAIRRVRPIRTAYAYDANREAAERFAKDLHAQPVDLLDNAVAQSDIVVTCTTARAAILDAPHLHPGLFIAAVGADNPEKQELTRADVRGDLADLLRGRVAGRVHDDEIFVFDSTGTALQDVAVASLAYGRAVECGAGVDVAFGD